MKDRPDSSSNGPKESSNLLADAVERFNKKWNVSTPTDDETETDNSGMTDFKVSFPNRPQHPKEKIVSLSASWGNDDVESTIVIALKIWESIKAGCDHVVSGESWYEGASERVTWSFEGRRVSIDGEDGRQCVIDMPIYKLFVEP